MDAAVHWDTIYTKKGPKEVSWYQSGPGISVEIIENSGIDPSDAILDVGSGRSNLIGVLLSAGYSDLSVLDISAAAIEKARLSLGTWATQVEWYVNNILEWTPPRTYGFWHDRASFHFLTEPAEIRTYVEVLRRALKPGGQALIATFATDGPEKCSGLEVSQYDASSLCAVLGSEFELIDSFPETHVTPWGKDQNFIYCHFRYNG